MLRITELARRTGASTDEIRYLETKGFIKSQRTRLKQRRVRQFPEDTERTVSLVIKYRRQGFTWKSAHDRALEEINRPAMF